MLALFFVASHGAWFYKPIDDDASLALAKRVQLTEVYTSIGALPLTDATTPSRVARWKAAGLRVEALIDAPDVETTVKKIVAFNAAQPPSKRFDGVHYDHEPWIGTGESMAWVEPLLAKYKVAATLCQANGLSFTADISGAKFAHLTAVQRQALAKAATRLVLMEYETPLERVAKRLSQALADADNARFVAALRVKDFGCHTPTMLDGLEKQHASHPRYGGWAIFGSLDICP